MSLLWARGVPAFHQTIRITSDRRFISAQAVRDLIGPVDYPIDGVVFKVNDIRLREQMGSTATAPRWAVALKFAQERAVTRVVRITIECGRTGVLTPAADLVPVLLDGTMVSRATLHNEDFINTIMLQEGDEVVLQKAAAIIPEIVRSVTADKRREQLLTFYTAEMPNSTPADVENQVKAVLEAERPAFSIPVALGGCCPCHRRCTDIGKAEVMGDKKKKKAQPVAWSCLNPSCPEQLAGRIEHLCSREALDNESIGEQAAGAISATGLLKTGPTGIFQWSVADFAGLSWDTAAGGTISMGVSKAEKAAAALERAKGLPLHRWLYGAAFQSAPFV